MPVTSRALQAYYAASIAFLALDFGFGLNLRVTFLDGSPAWRLVYYAFCLALFVVMLWRPSWSGVLGGLESLVTLVALILTMGVRVMVPATDMLGYGSAYVTFQEVFNFTLSGGIAWLAWQRATARLAGRA